MMAPLPALLSRVARAPRLTHAMVARARASSAGGGLGGVARGGESGAGTGVGGEGGPCVVYGLHGVAYLQLTCRSNATTLVASRGPGFMMPSDAGFAPLPADYEPSTADVLQRLVGDGRDIVFAGVGEPTLRLETMLGVMKSVRAEEAKEWWGGARDIRLNTNGLAACVYGRCIVDDMVSAGLTGVSVALNTADPVHYGRLMRSIHGPDSHSIVCAFVEQCVSAGLLTECTAVSRPGVDVAAVERLANELGASFRSRTYFP